MHVIELVFGAVAHYKAAFLLLAAGAGQYISILLLALPADAGLPSCAAGADQCRAGQRSNGRPGVPGLPYVS